jgi:hypothetical protein
MFTHSSREKHGIRWWWHLRTEGKHRCIGVEFYWWSPRFGFSIGTDDEGWNLSARVPPFALYVSLEGLGLWQPTRTAIATWDNNRPFTLPDRREFDFYVSDWRVQFTPWGRWGEWRARDPWWIRGLSVDLKNLVLGRTTYEAEELALVPCHVPMPEGNYSAVAKVQRVTRGRTRWFKRTGQEVDLSIPKGIPFAGKGENSWDCDDDGLFGIGGNSIDDAIKRAQDAVNDRRKRYGHAAP